jgi:hypothetical protein
LNIQLLRFVYDLKQGQKCKVADDIEFPHELDLNPWVEDKQNEGEEPKEEKKEAKVEGYSFIDPLQVPVERKEPEPVGNPEYKYELVAVLLHLGATPFGGHYVAHIKSTYVSIALIFLESWPLSNNHLGQISGTASMTKM